MDCLTDFVLEFLDGLLASGELDAPETMYGVPEGASKLGLLTQYKWAKRAKRFGVGSHVLSMGRGSVKTHGAPEDRFFVGMPRGRTVVLEDVTTTGGSLLETIDRLNEANVEISAAIGLTNRMERRDDGSSVAEAIALKRSAGKPIKYYQMSSAIELLPEASRAARLSPEIIRSIEEEFIQFGTQTLKFA